MPFPEGVKAAETITPTYSLVVNGINVPDVMGEEMYNEVKAIIANKLIRDLSEVTDEATFKQDLEADSLGLVEIIMDLEEYIGQKLGLEKAIDIPDEDAESITRVIDVRHWYNLWQHPDKSLLEAFKPKKKKK